MAITKNKYLQKLFASGNVAGLKISIDRSPRITATTHAGKTFVLDSVTGLSGRDDAFVLDRIKRELTQSHINERFGYVVVDRHTNMTEKGQLHIALQEYGQDVYEGILATPQMQSYLNRTDSEDTALTPEVRAGIDSKDAINRLIYNLEGSTPCDVNGYDRMVQGKNVDIQINSKTGHWKATKNDACKACYAPLADLKSSDISNSDLLALILGNAPEKTTH